MKDKLFIIAVLLCSFCVFSCSNNPKGYPESVVYALKQAGSNRAELEKALDYYKEKNDALKYNAACFLIENMTDKYAIMPSDTNDLYLKELSNISSYDEKIAWEPDLSKIGMVMDSIRKHKQPSYRIVKDINVVTSRFLIENIEMAFKACRRLNESFLFEDFCEYVLPYRLSNEPLSDWRIFFYNKFIHYVDSGLSDYDIARQIIKDGIIHYNAGMSKYPYPISPKQLLKARWGNCIQMTYLLTMVLRSIGIPATVDEIPAWANRSSMHCWNIVFDESGKAIDIGFGENFNSEISYKVSKIYRKTFSIQQEYISHTISTQFDYPEWKDVTDEYKMTKSNIIIKPAFNYKGRTFLLCTFNNSVWVPVAQGKLLGDSIFFKSVGRGDFRKKQIHSYRGEGNGIVYLPVHVQKHWMKPLSSPFILCENGHQIILKADLNNKQTVFINRKYPKYNHIIQYEQMMLGGRFEASDNPDFSPKTLLWEIKNIPDHSVEEVYISIPQSYRFVRYVAPDHSSVNMGDIAFYSDIRKLQGVPFSSSISDSGQDVYRAFDGNIDTYFHTNNENESFIGLDFGRPEQITRIVYSPRTDNNDVTPGDEYELFYWDKGWCSLGKRIANSFELVYDNAPSNALFILHNHTRGKEERPFTYENNKQIWW
ncbi:discoidin domain-containing protein [Tannerella forsythia]|uniref:discoidin domain-containing protein n=1 Tax=Tannerella forsythia TaxID=28112 RepID=UPI00086B56C5|nr:discoidin domain-containing protein [Tannerella forsythia]SCQ19767.1 F5/8 type C domain protein [Tannerella forsythia]